MMRAIVITKPGAPQVLQIKSRPLPTCKSDEALIRVHAAGVNRPDIFQRKGNYPPPSWTSQDIPGLEVAGVVEGVGSACNRWKKGDKVCALIAGGGYAEFVAVPEGQCLPIPSNLSFVEAASLPETFFTVWSNVFDRGRLQPGETLLVHGGSSGIGVAAIQLAKAAGTYVITTAGSEKKCSFCTDLGADLAINYHEVDFRKELLALKKAPDVILDMVGGTYTQSNIDVLNTEGRLVLINHMEKDEAMIRLGTVMKKRITITGSTLRARDASFKSAIAQKLESKVWPWLADGKVRPVIDATFPLELASEAHRRMESGDHMGKIILTVLQ